MAETISCISIGEFTAKMAALVKQESFPDKHELISEFAVFSGTEEDGTLLYWSEAKMKESFLFAWFIPFNRTLYKTRRIKLKTEKEGSEIKVSLHEILRYSAEGKEAKKRKFRFYVKADSLSERFQAQCKSYLLNRISNNDLIKSIPHVKFSGQELL